MKKKSSEGDWEEREREREIICYKTIEESASLESWVFCCPAVAGD